MIDAADLRTVSQLAAECPAFTEDSIRWHIHRAKYNGLEAAGAIVRKGRRVYLVKSRFSQWAASGEVA